MNKVYNDVLAEYTSGTGWMRNNLHKLPSGWKIWEKVKVRLMYEICMCKFMQNPELRDKLLATGESTLIEGNNWGDYFWGKVNNCGENQLGIILMDVRAKLQWNAETAPNNIPQCLQ